MAPYVQAFGKHVLLKYLLVLRSIPLRSHLTWVFLKNQVCLLELGFDIIRAPVGRCFGHGSNPQYTVQRMSSPFERESFQHPSKMSRDRKLVFRMYYCRLSLLCFFCFFCLCFCFLCFCFLFFTAFVCLFCVPPWRRCPLLGSTFLSVPFCLFSLFFFVSDRVSGLVWFDSVYLVTTTGLVADHLIM